VGEAGIGKTRLARELTAEARERGATVLWGRYFEGDWSPLYGPGVEALGDYAQTLDTERLRLELGSNEGAIATLVPRIRLILAKPSPLAAPLGPEDERYRLYDAVGQFVLAIARDRPAILVLDDLHWADRDSLELLRFVARSAAPAPLLILGIYRHPESEDARFLTHTLAMLRREVDFREVAVRGLDPDDVARYLRGAANPGLTLGAGSRRLRRDLP
jgi:predicted ATPase